MNITEIENLSIEDFNKLCITELPAAVKRQVTEKRLAAKKYEAISVKQDIAKEFKALARKNDLTQEKCLVWLMDLAKKQEEYEKSV